MAEQEPRTGHPYPRNQWGMRDVDYGPKPTGRKRVLMLGDSFTYGLGVYDETQIFPAILERRLNEMDRFPGGVDVLNAAEPGSLTGDWLESYQRAVAEFDPDVVIAVFFLRDGTRLGSMPNFFGPLRDEVVRRNRASQLYRVSYLYRLVRDRLDWNLVAERYTREMIDAYLGSEEQTAEWTAASRHLRQLRDQAQQRGARFGLVIFPVLVQLDEGYPFLEICDLLEAYAGEQLEVPLHSLLPAFLGEDAPDLWVSPMNQHPNARGHAIAADSLLPFVVGLVDNDA